MSKGKFTVYTVLDGAAIEVLRTDSASRAEGYLAGEWKKHKGVKHRHHGVIFTDNPDAGDISPMDLADLRCDEKAGDIVRRLLLGATAFLVTLVYWGLRLRACR
jgi:hypothetical protein